MKHRIPYLVGAVIATLLACLAPAAFAATSLSSTPSLILAGGATQPPRIDGRLDDACWREAAQSTGFLLNTRRSPATEQTTIYVTYDQRALYVAFECLESQMDRLGAEVTERDGDIFRDDVVEVFLDPDRDRFTYYQFAVNARGTRFDLRGDAAGASAAWDAPWDAATAHGVDRWFAEFAIPFSSLGIHLGRTGDTWGINFAREQKPKGELSSWAFAGGPFAQPDRFGLLAGLSVDFSRYAYSIEVADPGERLAGNNVLKARVSAPFSGNARVTLEVFLPDGQAQRSAVNAALRPERPTTVMLPYNLPREGLYRGVVRVRDQRTGETLHAVGVPISVPSLLELAIFPSHYRQEVWLRPRLNVRQQDLKQFRLTARLIRNGTALPIVREKPFFAVKEPIIPFDLSKTGAGDYEISVTLAPRETGAGLVRETLRFTQAPGIKAETAPVSIHGDNTLLVRGKRFFPLGIYRSGSFNERSLRELREAGFNLMQAPLGANAAETRDVLDRIHAAGLKAWVPLGDMMEIPQGDEAKAQRLREFVPALADHPGLLLWESVDEPAWRGRNAADLTRGYQIVRSLDTAHPVWTNHAPRNTVDELALFNRATDIAGADIYPVPEPQKQSDLPEKTLGVVGAETEKNILAVLNRKPVFMVLQGFAWADLSRREGGAEPAVYPTFAQSRFMAYDAIVRGARGIFYWGAHTVPKPSPFWNDLRRVVFELSQLQDVLAGPDTPESVNVLAGGRAIETRIRRHAGTNERYIIAINRSGQPINARLQIPSAGSKVTWRVLFERRRVSGNPIVDHFAPYDVHVYTASTSNFPQERFLDTPVVTETPRPRPEDLTQPGNLLINPGFEYTEAGEDVPVGWNLRPIYNGGIAAEVKRSGRYCAFLRGNTDESSPLWVQSGIATQNGRRYRLTAHVRAQSADTLYRLYAEWTDENGKYLGGNVPAQWSAATDAWQPATLDFTVKHPGARRLSLVLQMRGKGQVWFDDVRLEETGK